MGTATCRARRLHESTTTFYQLLPLSQLLFCVVGVVVVVRVDHHYRPPISPVALPLTLVRAHRRRRRARILTLLYDTSAAAAARAGKLKRLHPGGPARCSHATIFNSFYCVLMLFS